jgi:hypothetical protein
MIFTGNQIARIMFVTRACLLILLMIGVVNGTQDK